MLDINIVRHFFQTRRIGALSGTSNLWREVIIKVQQKLRNKNEVCKTSDTCLSRQLSRKECLPRYARKSLHVPSLNKKVC